MGNRLKSIFIALFVVFLWATSWVFIKIGLREIPPLTFAGLRYTLAFFVLLVVLLLSKGREVVSSIPRSGWPQLLLLGILFYAATQGASFLALAVLPAVTVNMIWSFTSVVVALFGIIWLTERPKLHQWLGVGLATIGAVIFFYPAEFPTGQILGILISVVGVLTNAGASLLGRSINRQAQIPPIVVTTVSMGIGAILLLSLGLSIQGLPQMDITSWGIIFWLALVNTALAFTLWNKTLQHLSAMESSIINGTMLIWIPILAVVFLDESLNGKEIIGLCVAGLGTLVVQIKEIDFVKRFRVRSPSWRR